MGILSWIVFGLIAGGGIPAGCIITMLLGVAGAFVGGFLYELLTGRQQLFRFDLGSFAIVIVGAVILSSSTTSSLAAVPDALL